jgi:hypothetical protein
LQIGHIKQANDNSIPYFAFITIQIEKGALAAIARDNTYSCRSDAVKTALKIRSGKSPRIYLSDWSFSTIQCSIQPGSDEQTQHSNPQKYLNTSNKAQ